MKEGGKFKLHCTAIYQTENLDRVCQSPSRKALVHNGTALAREALAARRRRCARSKGRLDGTVKKFALGLVAAIVVARRQCHSVVRTSEPQLTAICEIGRAHV